MNSKLLRFCARLLLPLLLLSSRLSLCAAPAPGDLLVQAYTTLSAADHDYKGHRVAAMRHIEAAAKLLGVNLKGDGKGHEKQAVSDAQLRAAQTALQQAAAVLSGPAQKHVEKAEKELSIALSIK